MLEPGLPESFNVLVRELQALCLDVKLEESTEEKILINEKDKNKMKDLLNFFDKPKIQ